MDGANSASGISGPARARLCYQDSIPSVEKLSFTDLENGLVFAGLVGFIDPPASSAAIAECHSAGIDVKMITGITVPRRQPLPNS